MMKVQLRKLAGIICGGLVVFCTTAQANWSISKPAAPSVITVKAGKVKSHIVQIFSSTSATKAEGMKNTLAMHGYPAFIHIKAQPKQPYYQVQIGPFNSKNLAYNAKNSIIQLYPQFPFLNDAILKISFQH